MKKIYYPLACCLIGGMLASCGGGAKKQNVTEESTPTTVTLSYSKSLKGAETDSLTPVSYTHLTLPTSDLV